MMSSFSLPLDIHKVLGSRSSEIRPVSSMGRHFRQTSAYPSLPYSPRLLEYPEATKLAPKSEISSPFGEIEDLDQDDFCQVAYEVFFTSCRSSPGFGGRSALAYYNAASGDGNESMGNGFPMNVGGISRVKRALGLKMMGQPRSSRRSYSLGSCPFSDSKESSAFGTLPLEGRRMRPMTVAEIMRQQMRVKEQSDSRLRKTLMRTLVGHMGKRPETMILPLELLRHLKPSEFDDAQDYSLWQTYQLKLLKAGLLLHPLVPLEKTDRNAVELQEIIISAESKPIDTAKNSESMRKLSTCVISLAWRSCHDGTPEMCHWADGYPFNLRIYSALLSSIFDLKDSTLVLDEVDELLELMKKTWSTLGISRSMHNLCITWVFFEQYILTGQKEHDLLNASFVLLAEVATDAKKTDREDVYVRMLGSVVGAMKKWLEKRLLNYHGSFNKENVGLMENMLPLLFSAKKILEEDVPRHVISGHENGTVSDDLKGVRVDHYIRSSLHIAFAKISNTVFCKKMIEEQSANGLRNAEGQDPSEVLIKLARRTEELIAMEKNIFSPILKKWHPIATGMAAVSLHTCYGSLLKKYMAANPSMVNETVLVLQRAEKLEKALVQVVVEDSVECEDGGKAIVQEMVPFEVESIIHGLLKQRIQEKLQKGSEHILRAKQTETWNPKSKSEPYAHSATEVISFAKEAVETMFEIPVNIPDSLLHDFIGGLEKILGDYVAFVASCGSKQSYIPALPPLTRCSQDSKFSKLWKIAACSVGVEDPNHILFNNENQPRPSISRGTQRLYIRLNTLNYLANEVHALSRLLSNCPKKLLVKSGRLTGISPIGGCHFESIISAIQETCHRLSEVAAYRLIFLDSINVFYNGLYVGDVANTRISPTLRILKQNLTLLCAIVVETAQPLALKEVVKASLESFLLVLLAGGSSRHFSTSDHSMIEEDLESLKQVFCSYGEGLIVEDVVNREAEAADGVVALMGQSTEQLVEELYGVAGDDFNFEAMVEEGQKQSVSPVTGKWSRFDPATILRILCYRGDRAASQFLKKTFHLAKRRPSIAIA